MGRRSVFSPGCGCILMGIGAVLMIIGVPVFIIGIAGGGGTIPTVVGFSLALIGVLIIGRILDDSIFGTPK